MGLDSRLYYAGAMIQTKGKLPTVYNNRNMPQVFRRQR